MTEQERKKRSVRKAEIIVEANTKGGEPGWHFVCDGFNSTADAQKYLREATDLPAADFFRIIAVKWQGKVETEKVERRKLV